MRLLFLFLSVSVFTHSLCFGRLPEMINPEPSFELLEREGHTFFLNGRSIHTASVFKVKVYEISLYLERRSQNPEEILNSSERKIIVLHFLRKIGAAQLRSAFEDGFYENCEALCDQLKNYLEQLNSQIPDLKEGDRFEFQFLPGRTVLKSSLGNYSEVQSSEFGRILLSIWLGSNPPSSTLKMKF